MRLLTKKNLIIAACYSSVLILGMLIGPKFSKESGNTKNGSFLPFNLGGRSEKMDKILQIINSKYVDPIKVDTLQNLAIQEILKKLDPHSAYLPPADAQLMYEDLEGNFNGIGIEYYLLNDTLLITGVNPDGPADKAGVKRGDQVIGIDNKNIAGIKIRTKQIVEQIRGPKGSKVQLVVKRRGIADNQNILVERDRIVISSIDASYMLNDETGYVKISKFGAETDGDFTNSLSKMQQAGMKNLVLDLRENGGGYLNSATALADQFLTDKKLIVYTQGEHEPRTDYLATEKGNFEQGNLVVLIDENTASASEIVAGAIQDLDRGTIIGRRSFGKGLVQEQFDFGDGSALNLTIARYYTPSGRSIQRSYKKGAEAYYEEIMDRYKSGELNQTGGYADSLFDKNKVFKTTTGRVLYGGGGIMPDIYVPIDTVGITDFYYSVSIKGVLNDFMFTNLLKGNFPSTFNSFTRDFKISDDQYNKLVLIARDKGIKSGLAEVNHSKPVIAKELKALLARYYFGDEGYYKVINATDKIISKSLEQFSARQKAMLIRPKG